MGTSTPSYVARGASLLHQWNGTSTPSYVGRGGTAPLKNGYLHSLLQYRYVGRGGTAPPPYGTQYSIATPSPCDDRTYSYSPLPPTGTSVVEVPLSCHASTLRMGWERWPPLCLETSSVEIEPQKNAAENSIFDVSRTAVHKNLLRRNIFYSNYILS